MNSGEHWIYSLSDLDVMLGRSKSHLETITRKNIKYIFNSFFYDSLNKEDDVVELWIGLQLVSLIAMSFTI